MTYRVSNWTILNDKDERLFEMSYDGGLHCTSMGLMHLCDLLNSGGQLSEQGEPLYGRSLDELRVRIASLYDEIGALRKENQELKRQAEKGRRRW